VWPGFLPGVTAPIESPFDAADCARRCRPWWTQIGLRATAGGVPDGRTPPAYAIYGGVALRGPIVAVLEGTLEAQHDTRLVVLQFPSLQRARAGWESGQYRPLVKLRQSPVADTPAFLVDGVDLGNQR
jgi:uncharacterized protein (DUF1330 family)